MNKFVLRSSDFDKYTYDTPTPPIAVLRGLFREHFKKYKSCSMASSLTVEIISNLSYDRSIDKDFQEQIGSLIRCVAHVVEECQAGHNSWPISSYCQVRAKNSRLLTTFVRTIIADLITSSDIDDNTTIIMDSKITVRYTPIGIKILADILCNFESDIETQTTNRTYQKTDNLILLLN